VISAAMSIDVSFVDRLRERDVGNPRCA